MSDLTKRILLGGGVGMLISLILMVIMMCFTPFKNLNDSIRLLGGAVVGFTCSICGIIIACQDH